MNWLLYIGIGAGCGWLSAAAKKDGEVVGSVAAGALAGLVLGVAVSFLFAFLFFVAKLLCVVFGVLIVLALLGAGKSD